MTDRKIVTGFLAFIILFGLWLTTFHSYLLFHSLAEIFGIVVAFSVFIIARNTKRFLENSFLTIFGISFLFIGGLDLMHTLSYVGMGIFQDYQYYANQLS